MKKLTDSIPGEKLLGLQIDLNEKLRKGNLSLEELSLFLQRKNPFEKVTSASDFLADWTSFYKKHFNLKVDFSEIKIPEKPTEGKWRLLFIAKGLTNNKVYDACKRKFPCDKYTDMTLDEVVLKNNRDPKDGSYAIWVRDVVEADEIYKNKSANQLAKDGIKGITLLERMLLELKFFAETEKHLDINNWTLCSGSCYVDDLVPDAYWGGDWFRVGWYRSDCSTEFLRCREVVS